MMTRAAFKEAGCFTGKRYVGDFELWLRIAARYPVVTVGEGLVWLRTHEGQEISSERVQYPYGTASYPVYMAALTSDQCPLSIADRARAVRRVKRWQTRTLLRIASIDRSPTKAMRIAREMGLGLRDLPCAFTVSDKQ
jgi:hypothetical protein